MSKLAFPEPAPPRAGSLCLVIVFSKSHFTKQSKRDFSPGGQRRFAALPAPVQQLRDWACQFVEGIKRRVEVERIAVKAAIETRVDGVRRCRAAAPPAPRRGF